MAKVRFRGDSDARVTHQAGAKQCVHEFPCEVDPDQDASCFRVLSAFEQIASVSVTSQPAKEPKP